MNPLSFAITAVICAAALIVNAAAIDVLVNAVIGMAAVLLLRSAVGDGRAWRVLGMTSARFWAQLSLIRIPGRRRQPKSISQVVSAYGLNPAEVGAMTPDGRLKERDRLQDLLRDMDQIARLRPMRPLLTDPEKLRRALAARAGAGAVSYASIFDAACLARDRTDWPEGQSAAIA